MNPFFVSVIVTFFIFLSLQAPQRVQAWGRDGHQIIAAIAESRLTTITLLRVQSILRTTEPIASVSVWSDEVRPQRRQTAPWHYVDFPIHTDEYDPARCPNGDCVTMIIERLSRELVEDVGSDPLQREEKLKHLIHFVGDQAQPLHNANEHGDKGGNDKKVNFFGRDTNLHAVWDTQLLGRYMEEMGYSSQQTLELLNAEIRPELERRWSRGTPVDWTVDSNRLAVEFAYPGWSPVISRDYYLKSIGTMRNQLQKGGVRLAHLLNTMFDPHNYNGLPVVQRPAQVWQGWRRAEPFGYARSGTWTTTSTPAIPSGGGAGTSVVRQVRED
jgi:hypothetical protein